jgi:hypothetical protein
MTVARIKASRTPTTIQRQPILEKSIIDDHGGPLVRASQGPDGPVPGPTEARVGRLGSDGQAGRVHDLQVPPGDEVHRRSAVPGKTTEKSPIPINAGLARRQENAPCPLGLISRGISLVRSSHTATSDKRRLKRRDSIAVRRLSRLNPRSHRYRRYPGRLRPMRKALDVPGAPMPTMHLLPGGPAPATSSAPPATSPGPSRPASPETPPGHAPRARKLPRARRPAAASYRGSGRRRYPWPLS